jgi:class 3 adenylate cyclase/predicted ATPase
MKCPKCGFGILPSFKFCAECGHKIVTNSEAASKELSYDGKIEKIQRYLPKGLTDKILSQRDKIEGEHKQVTVMFCDIEGFTAISERIGPEVAYSVMDQVYEILINRVHDYDGTVNEMTGDGIMALFGAPIALEDAPERSIRSALAIHREMVKFSDKFRGETKIPSIRMRIGIHTGPVVVGTLGNDLRVEFKAVGDTVNLASRMEEIAEPGTTYVTKDTFKLTEGLFRFESLGNRQIKGKYRPVDVYRVLAPSSRRTRFDVSSERGLTPFVGRKGNLELLLDGFERAKAGRGQAFSIVAEAGIGKSRLLYEFRKAIANEDVTWLEGKSLSYRKYVAYHPIIDILKTNFRIRESDSEKAIEEKVKAGLRQVVTDGASTLPYLLDLLSVKESGIDKIFLSPEAKKARTFEALMQIVLKGSELRPLIVAIEDLHWIDKSSEESLNYLLEGIPEANVMIIFTYRPEFNQTWGRRSYHSQITLNGLSNSESLAVSSYLLGTQELVRALENLILKKTEGVPFFIEEFVRSLLDLKIIEKKDDTYHLTENYQALTIPSRIQDVVMARVDALPDNAKEVLQIGSVIGREFSHGLLKKIVKFNQQDLLSYLSVLKDAELVYERGIYPKSTYIFKHALTQESIYTSLLKRTRQKYHRVIADCLERHFPEITELQPELLGYHFSEADSAEKAIPYFQRAGEISVRRSANTEAVEHFTKGLELIERLPIIDKRIRQELTFRVAMGPALIAIKGWGASAVEQTYARARELCDKVGDIPNLFTVLRGLWNLYNTRSEYKTSFKIANQLLELAQRLKKSDYLLGAHRALGAEFFWHGDFPQSLYHQEQVIALYDSERHKKLAFIYWTDPKIHCLAYLGPIMWVLGFPEKAYRNSQESLILADELSHSYSFAISLFFSIWLFVARRDIDKVHELTEKLMGLSKDERFPLWPEIAAFIQNWASAVQGKGKITGTQISRVIATVENTGTQQIKPLIFTLLAEEFGIMNNAEEGLQALKKAENWNSKTDGRYWESEIYRLKGKLLLAQSANNQNDAETAYHLAIEISRRQQAKSFELRAAMDLSRLWQSQGKNEEARNLLSEIYGWFTEGFDTADLKDAKALLDELC